jgi:hypothetical protein
MRQKEKGCLSQPFWVFWEPLRSKQFTTLSAMTVLPFLLLGAFWVFAFNPGLLDAFAVWVTAVTYFSLLL